jgi:uncharacterized protein (DUF2141 family)
MSLILGLFRGGSYLVLAAPLVGAAPPVSLAIELQGLRSRAGEVRLCVSREPRLFPDCGNGTGGRLVTVAAGTPIRVEGLAAGDYAVALFHDENRNGRLDTIAGIPREGFGFSRNPGIAFGPPSFAKAQIRLAPGHSNQTIRVRYLL